MKFGMFFMGEFIEVIVLSALAATLFFGGYDLPFLERNGFMVEAFGATYAAEIPHAAVIGLQMLTFTVKVAVLIWFQLMIRWTLPRFRYDQIMAVCWKYLLPLSLLNILVTGIVILLWQN
jgi:NADH-quinone oxidoreductase subunit H